MRIRLLLMVLLAGLASWVNPFGLMLGGSFLASEQHMSRSLDCLDAALAGQRGIEAVQAPGHVLLGRQEGSTQHQAEGVHPARKAGQ